MTLTELRYVAAVDKHRHFGRAAEACFVSQPTLSVAIKKLEDELGVQIFERGRSDVLVTPGGEAIVEQAKLTLLAAEQIKEIASASKDQLSSPLRVGAIYTVGPYLLPRILPALQALAPEMQLRIREGYTSDLLGALRDGELDVAFVSTPIDDDTLEIDVLYEEPFVVALPADHRWGKRKQISAAELGEETLLLLGAGNCFRDQVMTACPGCVGGDQFESEIQRTLEGGSLETIRQMVATGAGITVLPGSSVSGDADMGGLLKLRPFSKPVPSREVALVWRRAYPRTRAVQTLRQAVENTELGDARKRPPALKPARAR